MQQCIMPRMSNAIQTDTQPIQSLHRLMEPSAPINLVFIDPHVEDSRSLIADVRPNTQAILLDPERNGVEQITQHLQTLYTYLPESISVPSVTVHIVSHGAPGCLFLGDGELSLTTLAHHAAQLQQWFPMADHSALLLYGCQVAAGQAGTEFIQALKHLTGVTIAASANRTGASALGGDWQLEVTTDEMDVELAFGDRTQTSYAGVFETFTPFDPNTQDPQLLVDALVPTNIGLTIIPGSIGFVGGEGQTSFYDGSLTELGIESGLLLTSGDGTPPLTNTSNAYSESQFGLGDSDLQTVANDAFDGAGATEDANILDFSFIIDDPEILSIRFSLMFGSDEFPEFSNSQFVDVAGIFLNGQNIGLFQSNNQPFSVIDANLEVGNFINNDADTSSSSFTGTTRTLPIEYDGVSAPFTFAGPVQQGINTLKIAIADTGDDIYDSGLFVANLTTSIFSFENISGFILDVAGTDSDDVLVGTASNEFFNAGLGNDQVDAQGGNDIVDASDGNDIINTGDGNDEVNAGQGDDTVIGGNGADILRGEGGNDLISGGADNDRLIGSTGNDSLSGDEGDDTIRGGLGDDIANGGSGNDRMEGGDGNDNLTGLSGDDVILGEFGNDTMDGGSGNDRVNGGNGKDLVNGGNGSDRVDGGKGNDRIDGGKGNDTLIAGAGKDRLDGGKGKNRYILGKGKDIVILTKDKSRDTIRNFNPRKDVIDLPGNLRFSGITLEQRGNNVFVLDGNNELASLQKVDVNSLGARNFR